MVPRWRSLPSNKSTPGSDPDHSRTDQWVYNLDYDSLPSAAASYNGYNRLSLFANHVKTTKRMDMGLGPFDAG
ncbi:hypothetical protein EVAR_18427_1 [Eumeta japonica]|uniref:Uncharacterized protein n=1 Tax=Eumeta variegata TaxID=151549 RepID=A0A4C1UV98_EUMVA|nr:hypothetical protein EVAR_18427_1 [Eumeta japonica]